MQIWRGMTEVPTDIPPTALTIGTFDGVHLGHRHVLELVVRLSAERGLAAGVVTFDPHPMSVLRPGAAPLMLTSLAHRLELLAETGVAGTLVLPFDQELAARSADWFVREVLVAKLRAREVMVGRNFRFGHRAAGDVALLEGLGRTLGFTVSALDLTCDVTGHALSSTAIRGLIAAGEVAAAAVALGRAHRVAGLVVHGDQRGRELGYATANLALPADLAVPADGVYAGWLHTTDDSLRRMAAISIGTNPTFAGVGRRVEAYVLDAPSGYDIYGVEARLDFVARLRAMIRFDSVAELLVQMADDVTEVRRLLGE